TRWRSAGSTGGLKGGSAPEGYGAESPPCASGTIGAGAADSGSRQGAACGSGVTTSSGLGTACGPAATTAAGGAIASVSPPHAESVPARARRPARESEARVRGFNSWTAKPIVARHASLDFHPSSERGKFQRTWQAGGAPRDNERLHSSLRPALLAARARLPP